MPLEFPQEVFFMDLPYAVNISGYKEYDFDLILDCDDCDGIVKEQTLSARWKRGEAAALLVATVAYGFFAFLTLEVSINVFIGISSGWQTGITILFPILSVFTAAPMLGMMHGVIQCWRAGSHHYNQVERAHAQKEHLLKNGIKPDVFL